MLIRSLAWRSDSPPVTDLNLLLAIDRTDHTIRTELAIDDNVQDRMDATVDDDWLGDEETAVEIEDAEDYAHAGNGTPCQL